MSAAAVVPIRQAVFYPQKDAYLCVHESLVQAVGNFAEAAILSFLEFRWKHFGRAFQHTQQDIVRGIMGAVEIRALRDKLHRLAARGFIEVKGAPGNPNGDWFTVNVSAIQAAVLAAARAARSSHVQTDPGKIAEVNPGKSAAPSFKANIEKPSTTTTAPQTVEIPRRPKPKTNTRAPETATTKNPGNETRSANPGSVSAAAVDELAGVFGFESNWAARLIAECRAAMPDITVAEVTALTKRKYNELRRGIQAGRYFNVAGLLIDAVPKMGTVLGIVRATAEAERRARERDAERHAEEMAALRVSLQADADNEALPDEERRQARELLDALREP